MEIPVPTSSGDGPSTQALATVSSQALATVSTQALATATVSTQALATVSTQALATASVSTQALATASVSTQALATASVSTQALATATVSTQALATASVSTQALATASVSTQALATATVSTQALATATVSIEFVLCDGVRERSDWALHDTVETMKQQLALNHNLSLADITVSYNGEQLSDTTTVEELGPDSTGLSLIVGAGDSLPSPPTIPGLGDVGVHVQREVVVQPFLGGYRHKLTGIEYLNASAQTTKKIRHSGVTSYQRDTQTVLTKNQPQQVHTDTATQMNKTGCFINARNDKVIFATGVYETADMYHYRLLSHVMLLQRQWRGWLARRYVNVLRGDKIARDRWEKQEAERRTREREERARKEFDRRMNPRTKEDFDLLYHALEMWRLDELGRINQTTSGPERKAALCDLLEHESQLIASIGKHKIEAGKEHKSMAVQRFLDAAAAPKRWTAFDGGLTEMDTPFTIRAQQLRDIYTTITMETVTRDERLDILLTLKCTVKEHDCKLTRELVELVDREADLLVRGLDSGDSLKGLRSRIAGLFFKYCKVPLFNPEAAKHIIVPQDPASLRANIYYCKSCCKYLSSTEFELSTNSRAVGRCRSCRELDNRARAREDLTLYRAMLTTIRTTEESFGDSSTVIFLMQEPDLRHLLEGIWAGQSALSAEKDLFELVLVRWDNSIQWSPWNTVCLTTDEATGHCKLGNVYEAYGYEFVRKVHYRHVLAKSYFSSIPGMRDHMTSKVKELPLPRPKERELTVTQKH